MPIPIKQQGTLLSRRKRASAGAPCRSRRNQRINIQKDTPSGARGPRAFSAKMHGEYRVPDARRLIFLFLSDAYDIGCWNWVNHGSGAMRHVPETVGIARYAQDDCPVPLTNLHCEA